MAWLDTHPPRVQQFRRPRREEPSGVVVVHTAENTPDFVAFDGGAEAVAGFIQRRTDFGSYHDLVDSDSRMHLVEYTNEAFHDGTGSNRHSYGVSVATRADVWPFAPQAWRDGAIRQAASAAAGYARWLRARNGVVIPARRINRAESEMRIPGFLSHAERDPARRSDPGAGFPWDQFLAEFRRLTAAPTPAPIEEEIEMLIVDPKSTGAMFLLVEGKLVGIKSQDDMVSLQKAGAKMWSGVSDSQWQALQNAFPTVHG